MYRIFLVDFEKNFKYQFNSKTRSNFEYSDSESIFKTTVLNYILDNKFNKFDAFYDEDINKALFHGHTFTANATTKPMNSQRPVPAAKFDFSAISMRSNDRWPISRRARNAVATIPTNMNAEPAMV